MSKSMHLAFLQLLVASAVGSMRAQEEQGRQELRDEELIGTLELGDVKVRLSGYFDLELRDEQGFRRRFRFHRLVPMIDGQVSRRISFATEIEIEDGEDLSVEFAHLDYELSEQHSFRAGAILLPLGRLNLLHDSPIQELSDRPIVHRKVIPTTLRDAGFGLHGHIRLSDQESMIDSLDYELYLHSGFRGQDGSGAYLIDRSNGLRDARAHRQVKGLGTYEDNNNSLAATGRVSVKWPGAEIGVSGYFGSWDNRGDLDLGIGALDVEFSPRALASLEGSPLADLEFLFEGAIGDVETDSAARAAGVPDSAAGWYAQLGFKVFTSGGETPLFEEGGGLTLLLRHGRTDLDGARFERTVLGFNIRPNADRSVIKFEYQLNSEGGLQAGLRNDAFIASIATYF